MRQGQGQGHDFYCPPALPDVEDSPRGPHPCRYMHNTAFPYSWK